MFTARGEEKFRHLIMVKKLSMSSKFIAAIHVNRTLSAVKVLTARPEEKN